MRVPSSAPMVCRVLIGLDRARACGTLRLAGEACSATVVLEDGEVVAANVDRRVASSRRQLVEGMVRACDWSGLALTLHERSRGPTWWRLGEACPARLLALGILRAAAARADAATVRADLGKTVYHLTDAGESLVAGADLRPGETTVVSLLRRGVAADEVPVLPGCGLRASRFLWMLKLGGAAAPRKGGSYPLLLRKRREMRQRASARALLDLPSDAHGPDARRALRKLVRDLHPDRFADGAPPALRRASGEIVSALVTAEAAIRSGTAD